MTAVYGYDGSCYTVGDRVELHPAKFSGSADTFRGVS